MIPTDMNILIISVKIRGLLQMDMTAATPVLMSIITDLIRIRKCMRMKMIQKV